MAVGIESEEVTEGLNGDHCAGNGIILRDRLLEKYLQRFPGTSAELGQQLSII